MRDRPRFDFNKQVAEPLAAAALCMCYDTTFSIRFANKDEDTEGKTDIFWTIYGQGETTVQVKTREDNTGNFSWGFSEKADVMMFLDDAVPPALIKEMECNPQLVHEFTHSHHKFYIGKTKEVLQNKAVKRMSWGYLIPQSILTEVAW